MKLFDILSIVILLSIVACTNRASNVNTSKNQQTLQKSIEALANTLANKPTNAPLDLKTANQLIDESTAYYKEYPKDKNSADYIFRAADVARGIGSYQQAIQLWGEVQQSFPNYKRTGDALFMQGFTYENNLNDKVNAKKCYKSFLQKYPNHPQKHTVQLSLENIDASPEDLIKRFKQNKN